MHLFLNWNHPGGRYCARARTHTHTHTRKSETLVAPLNFIMNYRSTMWCDYVGCALVREIANEY